MKAFLRNFPSFYTFYVKRKFSVFLQRLCGWCFLWLVDYLVGSVGWLVEVGRIMDRKEASLSHSALLSSWLGFRPLCVSPHFLYGSKVSLYLLDGFALRFLDSDLPPSWVRRVCAISVLLWPRWFCGTFSFRGYFFLVVFHPTAFFVFESFLGCFLGRKMCCFDGFTCFCSVLCSFFGWDVFKFSMLQVWTGRVMLFSAAKSCFALEAIHHWKGVGSVVKWIFLRRADILSRGWKVSLEMCHLGAFCGCLAPLSLVYDLLFLRFRSVDICPVVVREYVSVFLSFVRRRSWYQYGFRSRSAAAI